MKCFAWLFIYTSQLSPPRQPHVSEPKTILMPPLPPTSSTANTTQFCTISFLTVERGNAVLCDFSVVGAQIHLLLDL
jgi:hypothetical protein